MNGIPLQGEDVAPSRFDPPWEGFKRVFECYNPKQKTR